MSLDITFKNTGESFNITHNLATMAKECTLGNDFTLYDMLWDAEKKAVNNSGNLAEKLPFAIWKLYRMATFFDQFDARALYGNDWGLREHLIKFCEDLLLYAIKHPCEMFEVSK